VLQALPRQPEAHGIPTLTFRPVEPAAKPVPAIVYLHGGGIAAGDAEGDQLLLRARDEARNVSHDPAGGEAAPRLAA
jgi:acetyl esterase/lipase